MKNIDSQEYMHAVWDFMLEHCDITKNGSVFVKFHTSHRKDFEKRVMARYRGYHRPDPENRKGKKGKLRQEFMDRKVAKAAAYNTRKYRYKKIQKSNFIMKVFLKLKWRM